MQRFEMSTKPRVFDKNSLVYVKSNNMILQDKISGTVFFESSRVPLSLEEQEHCLFIGELYGRKVYAIEKNDADTSTRTYRSFLEVLDNFDPVALKAVFRAHQLLNWHKSTGHCGCCGTKTNIGKDEFVKICADNPYHKIYPQYSPSIVVAIRHGEQVLLGRSHFFRKGVYGPLAGFMEAGETAEAAVRREVMEEVGIEIKNIRPFSTGPWPFPNSLMLGFTAEYASGELKIDPKEIEDARWFHYTNLPKLPIDATLSRQLVLYAAAQCEKAGVYAKTRGEALIDGAATGTLTSVSSYFSQQLLGYPSIKPLPALSRLGYLPIAFATQSLLYHETCRQRDYFFGNQQLTEIHRAALATAAGGATGVLLSFAMQRGAVGVVSSTFHQAVLGFGMGGVAPTYRMKNPDMAPSERTLKSALLASMTYTLITTPIEVMKTSARMRAEQSLHTPTEIAFSKALRGAGPNILFKAVGAGVAAAAFEVVNETRGFGR